ncbi:MAG: agmatine deiminase family protein [Bacteroidia bacterium]|nr:agmatine deiminase family protein [Bacteroidia bacterium]
MKINGLILVLSVVFGINATAQNLPHQLTPQEKERMQTYLESFQHRNSQAGNFLVFDPPASKVRAAAEWEEIDGLLVTWTSYLPTVREIIRWARLETTVWVVCSDSNAVKNSLTNNNIPLSNIRYLQINFDSVWSRDYGQWNVYTNDVDSLYMVDWIYNRPRPDDDVVPEFLSDVTQIPMFSLTQSPNDLTHTGGNYMVDGYGTAFSSELILDENPTKTQAQIDTIMKHFMGIQRYVKMPTLPYDGIHHIDMHLKLLDEETLLWAEYPNGVADGPQIEANLQYVQSNYPSVFGTPYKIVRIPSPPEIWNGNEYYPDNQGAYLTYTNAVFVNKTVLVTQYYTAYDTIARRIWETALPGYKIQFIDCNDIIQASGALHCITKEVMSSDPLLITHQALHDTYNTTNDYRVDAWIKHRSGIASATLFYTTDTTQAYQSVAMSLTNAGTNTWTGFIPAQVPGTKVYYYVAAQSNSGKSQVRPMPAPQGYWKFEVLGPVSTFEPTAELSVNLFPNPSNALVCLNLNRKHSIPVEASIYNAIGQQVGRFSAASLDTGNKKLFFDSSALAPGVYTVVVSTEQETKSLKLGVK